jgi:hypothetical protein
MRITPRLVISLALAGIVSYIILVVAVNMIVWHRHDILNAQRLKFLQADSLLRCPVTKISPWHEKEEMIADLAGTTHGIGFRGRSLTSVTRMFSLKGADQEDVIKSFAVCAQSSGWMLIKRPNVALSGTKSFPAGWTANLDIYILSHPPFTDQPIVQVQLSTDPI